LPLRGALPVFSSLFVVVRDGVDGRFIVIGLVF
jgi:hypothetical protein